MASLGRDMICIVAPIPGTNLDTTDEEIDQMKDRRITRLLRETFGMTEDEIEDLDEAAARTELKKKMTEARIRAKIATRCPGQAADNLREILDRHNSKRKCLAELCHEIAAYKLDKSIKEKLKTQFDRPVGDILTDVQTQLHNDECPILVAGEISSGKSTFLNLLLGEDILPVAHASSTSTICEVKYGETPQAVVHLRKSGIMDILGPKTVTIPLGGTGEHQQQLKSYIHLKGASRDSLPPAERVTFETVPVRHVLGVDAGLRHDAERAPTFLSGTRPVPDQSPVLTRAACGRVPIGFYSSVGQLSGPWRGPGRILARPWRDPVLARQPLPAGLKLAITLRFLVTGNSYRSLEFPLRVAHMQHNITVLKYTYAGLSSRLFSTAHRHSDTQVYGVTHAYTAGACSAARWVLGSEVTASLRRISPNGARSDFNSELKSIWRPCGAKNRPAAVGKPAGLRPGLGGIVLVDSPGVGESEMMDKAVADYVSKAFAFLYIIDSSRAGGVQKDRDASNRTLADPGSQLTTRVLTTTPKESAMFICNKWDTVLAKPTKEQDELKSETLRKLSEMWPGLEDSQVFFVSTDKAVDPFGILSEDFTKVLDGLNLLLPKSLDNKLETQYSAALTHIDPLINVARQNLDKEAQLEMYQEAQKLLQSFQMEVNKGKIELETVWGSQSKAESILRYYWKQAPKGKPLVDILMQALSSDGLITDLAERQMQPQRDLMAVLEADITKMRTIMEQTIHQTFKDTRSNEEIVKTYEPQSKYINSFLGRLSMFHLTEMRKYEYDLDSITGWRDTTNRLGGGSFGEVYRVQVLRKGVVTPAALKLGISPYDIITTETAWEFLKEEDNLRKLRGDHIVEYYGTAYKKEKGALRLGLVTELCKGTLADRIIGNRDSNPEMQASPFRDTQSFAKQLAMAMWPMAIILQPGYECGNPAAAWWGSNPAKQVAAFSYTQNLAMQLCKGLKTIHDAGYIHRDLKLSNILVTENDVVKLADVGQTKREVNITGTPAGTPLYAAPEVKEQKVYDKSADIYSLGLILWEMWYGITLYELKDDTYSKRIEEDLRRGRDIRMPNWPDAVPPIPGWISLIHDCLKKDPRKRPQIQECLDRISATCMQVEHDPDPICTL
ncbi:hypothetical protein Bbelb_038550 [Branchiostoma belcheri]|nr:hypothetical protein Bbelb_038550 [Branchiostoma belcheri]